MLRQITRLSLTKWMILITTTTKMTTIVCSLVTTMSFRALKVAVKNAKQKKLIKLDLLRPKHLALPEVQIMLTELMSGLESSRV